MQQIEQRLRLAKIGCVEAIGEPAVHRREKIAGFAALPRSRQSRARLMALRSSNERAFCWRATSSALRRHSSAWGHSEDALNSWARR